MNNDRNLYILCRYFAAALLLLYGFAKINGSQFTVVDWVLDEPMGEVSGFWLTWYYFGYSTGYKLFIASLEVGSGLLLLFRRTTLLGSVAGMGVILNILLIDIFFAIDLGGLIMALLICGSLLIILDYHRDELIELFWTRQNNVAPADWANRTSQWLKITVRAAIIILPFYFTYWTAHYNNRFPTPIDGVWEVVQVSGELDQQELPTRFYFEYNRAHQTRFRYGDSLAVDDYHFEVDTESDSLHIWKDWLNKGEKYFTGRYDLGEDTLNLSGIFHPFESETHLVLDRVR